MPDFVQRKAGQNIIELVSKLTLREVIDGVSELISNAYDADATRVVIDYNGSMLSVRDNGHAMTREQLNSFFTVGDSPKAKNRMSSGGRVYIGKFGVGTTVIPGLADNYRLVSRTPGLELIVEEHIVRPLSSEREIPVISREYHGTETGTALFLNDLVFKEDDLPVQNLLKELPYRFIQLPDFQIILNGEPLPDRLLTNCREFTYDVSLKKLGHAHGSFFLGKSSHKMAGIHVYVNNRRVGNPKTILERVVNRHSIKNRLVGIIHADGLDSAILFDRGTFKLNHPGYRQLLVSLADAVKPLIIYQEDQADAETFERYESLIIDQASSLLSRKEVRKTMGTTYEGARFSETLPFSLPGIVKDGIVQLNKDYAGISITSDSTPVKLRQQASMLLIDILALHKSNGSMDEYLGIRSTLIQQLSLPRREKKAARLMENAIYTSQELPRLLDLSRGSVNYLQNTGAIPENGRVRGGKLIEIRDQLRGRQTLYDFVDSAYGQNHAFYLERYDRLLGEIGTENAAPFFCMPNGSRFVTVEAACGQLLAESFRSIGYDRKSRSYDPRAEFIRFKEQEFTLAQIAKVLTGQSITMVSEVIDWANDNGFELRQKVRLSDYVKAMQEYRRNGNPR